MQVENKEHPSELFLSNFVSTFDRFLVNPTYGTLVRTIVFIPEVDNRWRELIPEIALKNLKQQLRLLTQFGIQLPEHGFFYESLIPFDHLGETRLFSEVEVVTGVEAAIKIKEKKLLFPKADIYHSLFELMVSLLRYLHFVISQKNELMFDIFRLDQYMYGTTPSQSQPKLYLIDFEYATFLPDHRDYFEELTDAYSRSVKIIAGLAKVATKNPDCMPDQETLRELRIQADQVADAFIETYPVEIESKKIPKFGFERKVRRVQKVLDALGSQSAVI